MQRRLRIADPRRLYPRTGRAGGVCQLTRARTQLKDLASLAQTQGFLTYDQVNGCLPDECADSVHVDAVLDLLDGLHVKLVEGESSRRAAVEAAAQEAESVALL